MALPSSGPISLLDIQNEFGGTNPIGINEYYGVASGVPASGTISFDDFYGTSASITADFGYVVGGLKTIFTASRTGAGARFTFSNETFSGIPSYPQPTIYNNNGLQSLPNGYGYFGGGIKPSPPPPTFSDQIVRIQFSNNTYNVPGTAPLTFTASGVYSGDDDGFYIGGYRPNNNISNVTRIQFSNETLSAGTNIPSRRSDFTTLESPDYGYICGGKINAFTPSPSGFVAVAEDDTQRFDKSTETTSAIPTTTPQNIASYQATFNPSYGFIISGYTTPPSGSNPVTYVRNVRRLDYSNETFSSPGALIPQAVYFGKVVQDISDYGWILGGNPGSVPPSPGALPGNIRRYDISNNTFATPGTVPSTYGRQLQGTCNGS